MRIHSRERVGAGHRHTGVGRRKTLPTTVEQEKRAEEGVPETSGGKLDFTGSTVGVYWLVSPDAGAAEWSIDEGPWQTTPAWDAYAQRFSRAHYRFLATDLSPGSHRLRLRVSANVPAGSTGRWLRIGAFLVEG